MPTIDKVLRAAELKAQLTKVTEAFKFYRYQIS